MKKIETCIIWEADNYDNLQLFSAIFGHWVIGVEN